MKRPFVSISPAVRALLLGSLIASSAACGQDPALELEPTAPTSPPETGELAPLPVAVEQALGGLRERSCQEIKHARPDAADGEYALYLLGDAARPWLAYCHDMAGTPREYLTLWETGLFSNHAQYTAGGSAPGTTVRTTYHRLRINPFTLRIDTSDRTFAASTGSLWHGSTLITAMPFATAMSCDWGDSGRANIDLRGTSFRVAMDSFAPTGYAAWGSADYRHGDQLVSLKGGGYCGWNAPPGADPFAGGTLQLYYVAATTNWAVAARAYPASDATTLPQTLEPGIYDLQDLSVGNDAITALHVPRGWSVTLHDNAGFQGNSRTYTASTDLTGSGFERRASSVEVQAPVLVYPRPGFQDPPQALGIGRHDIGQLTVGNDAIRSLRIPEGYQVTLFEHGGFRGDRLLLTQDTDLAGHAFDSRVSSLLVESQKHRDSNTLYGRWLSSGGQVVSGAGNRQFIVEYTGRPDIVTFELESPLGPYLYLQDAEGRVLTEANNADGGNVARIAAFLEPGQYRLVAATTLMGRTGDFTLRSDKARLRAPRSLVVAQAIRFDPVYDDGGTGADHDLSVWRPVPPPGFFSLGDIAMSAHGLQPRLAFVVSGEGDVLAPPTDYARVWSSNGAGGDREGSFWRPVAPAGYACLGAVASPGSTKPSTDLIRCVRHEYLLPATPTWVWDSRGAGAFENVTVFQTNATDHRAVTTSNFVPQSGLVGASGGLFWALNKSTLGNTELRGGIVDEYEALRYAPRIWLHPEEYYWPSSTEFFLAQVHESGGYLWTNEPLGCPSCTDPAFLDGQNPATTHVPVYIQLVTRTRSGAPTNITDVIYWNFYPYNGGKRVCIGFYTDWGGCLGGYSTFGNHVGDWEHLTLRFVDGRPSQVFMSQHAGGGLFELGNKAMNLVDFRPEAFSAKGSHALYPDAARHTYMRLFNGDTLDDDTGYGATWDAWNSPVIFRWQRTGTFRAPLDWLNKTARWGNDEWDCNNEVSKRSGECVLNSGPTAPLMKGFSHPSSLTME